MRSRRTAQFRKHFDSLPHDVQRQAQNAYKLFKANPQHGSLHFKKVHPNKAIYSLRITRTYRALGTCGSNGDGILWFWIGSHADYERTVRQM